jgi:hypothetical protein
MSRCIFTYANFQIERDVLNYNQAVVNKFKPEDCTYEFLNYNAPDGHVVPDQVIDYALQDLFFRREMDAVLIIDVDCVPLNTRAIEYTFSQAAKHILIGNAQRSNHIENNMHVYPAPSCICLTLDMFADLGYPSFAPTNRGDIGEELSYIAEQKGIEIELFLPSKYEALPYDSDKPWDLNTQLPKYGIGTTFVNDIGEEMFYHLFQCRLGVFNHHFYDRCRELLVDHNTAK